ncbi:MAG: COR domain-containing protein [Cyanobacteria bacterium P01_G01_bin.54]
MSLPQELSQLTHLTRLNLQDNQLTSLSPELSKLISLIELSLGKNRLKVLPSEIGQLTNLTLLSLTNNHLISLPKKLGKLINITRLELSKNRLKSLPPELGSLIKLILLSLTDNYLTSLPVELCDLIELEQLYLQNNFLKSLPSEFGKLTNLTVLGLNRNSLTSLPPELSQLPKLTCLHIQNNRLTNLPGEFSQLSSLAELDLHGNPLSPELAAAYEAGLKVVRHYLRATIEKNLILDEAKLILVGEGEVGKTSLLGAMRGDQWIEKRVTTHGVEVQISPLVIADKTTEIEITFNSWDFGGQNIYRHTHQLFFTAPAIYLAVWNPRRGPDQCRVDEWIKMVKHRAYEASRPDDKPHILVVATHGGPKERLDHIDEQALRDEFGDLIIGFHHVDSKTGYGLEELKAKIAQTAASIPQVGRTVPASWKRVLDAIRERSEIDAWISYEQFLSLCADQDVDLSLAKTYAAILNELGHLIHYSTDPALKEIVILKPEWLSKAISFVLEDKQVKDQNGLVRHSRLSELWDDPAREGDRYPAPLHPLFRKLMERCDLSYQVELPELNAPPTNLIAQLVPSKRPDQWQGDWQLKPGDSERSQVCRILDKETGRTAEAEGLMYRLIVRLHRYSLGRENYYLSRHWKNGMLLDDGFNGRAFLEEIGGDVYITVRAAYPSGFLGHLCAEVEWLVRSFWKGLDPRLYLPCPTDGCKGLLEEDEILEFKAQGMPKVRCAVCRKFHSIDSLMATTTAKPEWQTAFNELKQGQQDILVASQQGFDSLTVQLKILMSQADEQYRALLTVLTDPAKDGPRLFSLEPVDPGFWDKPKWIAAKFRLTLWCEHSRLPLTELNGNDTGIYEIEINRDWVRRASPLLRILSVTLKLALPIAIPGTKLATDEAAYQAINEQLEFGVKSADTFLTGGQKMSDWLTEGDAHNLSPASTQTRNLIRAQGSVLRELHALLRAQDPTGQFGNLERVRNKRQEFLWVHPQYVSEY